MLLPAYNCTYASRLSQRGKRNVSLASAGHRPVEPSKAVLQSASTISQSPWLHPSEPARPATAAAPRRQLRNTLDFQPGPAITRQNDGITRNNGKATSSSRLRIAVDVDEVLGRFVYTLNQFCLEQYGMKYEVDDYYIYEFAKIWKCSKDESNHIVHEFFKSQHFNDGIPVIPGALDTLTQMSNSCDLVVVTSRQHVIQDVTLEWIDRHFPGLFHEVYFGNHFALEGASRKKSEICRSIGASVLIDDNPGYAMDCAEAGIHVLLYDWQLSYPWSKFPKGEKIHPLITVVRDWSEVEQALEVLAPTLAAANHQ